jgi:spore maturation protein CgeB
MKIFVFGSSILSSYWNGAATYYRGCYKYLAARGHHITFAEPDAYGRQQNRDASDVSYVESIVYRPTVDIDGMLERASAADVVIKHSGIGVDDAELEARVPECSNAVRVFWDVDAPATLGRMHADPQDGLRTAVPLYDAVLTYGGGPMAREGYQTLGARAYYSIYNGLDPDTHHPVPPIPDLECDLAFVGNRLPDREARVEELFLRAAALAPDQSFLLGGEGWAEKSLPPNVRYIGHVPTSMHNRVNSSAGMVININRNSMADFGYSPPTRVFEAAGAGACLLCDDWPGISDCFEPQKELIVIRTPADVVAALRRYDSKARKSMGRALRKRALLDHPYARRAEQAEIAFLECASRKRGEITEQDNAPATMAEWLALKSDGSTNTHQVPYS